MPVLRLMRSWGGLQAGGPQDTIGAAIAEAMPQMLVPQAAIVGASPLTEVVVGPHTGPEAGAGPGPATPRALVDTYPPPPPPPPWDSDSSDRGAATLP